MEFGDIKLNEINRLRDFRDRRKEDIRNSGICNHIIVQDGVFFCPLHPKIIGTDLRENHCDINYICKTAKEFESWDEKKQEEFIVFVKERSKDSLDFSLKIDSGEFLDEFENLRK